MKKSTAFLIAVILIAAFAGLIYYGVTNSRGTPVKIEKIVTPLAEVPFIAQDIDLAQGISPELWQGIKPQEIKLMYQVTVLPWPKIKAGLGEVTFKAFHNKENIYFYLSWPDNTEDRFHETAVWPDAGAIMFPLEKKAQPHTIMMGFLGRVNIWQWKANQDREYWKNESPQTNAYVDFYYPFEEQELFPVSKHVTKSAVNDLLAIRVGTITPKDNQEVMGKGVWENGVWSIVLKRPLEALEAENGVNFAAGKKLAALAIWNGSQEDRGGRKSISDWVELNIQ
ncbi:MAG: ethylbenzene dehydrogenase-related protein [Candidatus Omnitrophota bacterium]|nr:ethylbenzene dehydrogenase-related protein [Candidatus Omnitrophota bacterium]